MAQPVNVVSIGPNVKLSEISVIRRIERVGPANGAEGIHIASATCPEVTGEGLTNGWKIMDAIAKAAAAFAAARAFQAAKKQEQIARKYYNLAKESWDYFYSTYRPLEQQELDEIHAEEKPKPDYLDAVAGHDCSDTIFDSANDHRKRIYSEYCICPDVNSEYKWFIALSTTRGDSHNFARRYAEDRRTKLDDLRFNRRLAAVARGRNLLSRAADWSSKAANVYGDYASAMSGLAGQALSFSGWIRHRRETEYPEERTRVGNRLPADRDPDGYNFFDASERLGIGYTSKTGGGNFYGLGGMSYQQGMNMIELSRVDNAFYAKTNVDPSQNY